MSLFFHPADHIPDDVLVAWAVGRRAQDPYSIFTGGYDWFRMMSAAKSAEAQVCVVRSSNGSIESILPLQRWDRSLGGRTVRTLKLVGGDGILLNPALPPWRDILNGSPDVDAIWAGHVPTASAACYQGAGVVTHALFRDLPHYRLLLPPTLEELWAQRSKSSIKKIFGRERAMGRDHGKATRFVEFRIAGDIQPFRPGIEAMMQTTWQARELGHGFDSGGINQLSEWGFLRSFALLLGEEPVAYAHGYQGAGTYVYAQIGFSAVYAHYSPGTILLYRILESFYSHPDRPLCVDFGEGDAAYKRDIANDKREVSSLLLLRDTPRLRMLQFTATARTALAAGLRRLRGKP